MDGRIIFRRARLVVASLATLLLFVGAASAVVTHEPPAPEPATSVVAQHEVRADVVGLTLAAPQSLDLAAVAAPEPDVAEVAPATTTTTTPPVTTTTAPAPTTTTVPATTTTHTHPPTTTTTAPAPTTTTAPPATTTTAPPPTTTTVASTSDGPPAAHLYLSESEVRALVAKYFPTSEVDKAVLVAKCESGWDAYVTGGSGGKYVGLFQHAGWVWESRAAAAGQAGKPWWDPEANVAVSAWLLNGDDWWHWATCSSWADGQLGG